MPGFDLNYMSTTDDEQAYVAWLMLLFSQARSRRVNFEIQWEESAALCWPEYRNSFAFGHNRPPGMKYTEFQIDSTGAIASHRFMAICDALLTPHNMLWSRVKTDNKDLWKDKNVREYYYDVTQCLWKHRYRPEAGFMRQNQKNWQQLGVFGNMGMLTEEYDSRPGDWNPGLSHVATSVGEMYKLKNHQGRTDGFIRHFRWPARMIGQRWGTQKMPAVIQAAFEKNSQELFDLLQFVLPNTEYDPLQVFNWKGHPYGSVYVCVAGYNILERGGYRSFPWASGGYITAPEEDYDRGPAQMVLPELKTLNSIAAMFLKQGHKAAEPAYLIADDGLVDLKTFPNAYNYGGLSSAGAKLVELLETGNIQVTQEMIVEKQKFVQDAFLTTLFPLLTEEKGPQRSAREVIEEANHRGIFLGPTLGGQYFEYIPTMIDRELDILSWQAAGKSERERNARGMMPKMPPIMHEAAGEYNNVYCSPLASMLHGQEQAGFMRMVEMAENVVKVTGDKRLMYRFDFDTALPDMADANFVPERWMASAEKIAKLEAADAKEAERENQVKSLPGQAAMAKAQAIVAKAQTGGNTGGALSGTAAGGMPMLPGQNAPGGRAFGQPGQQ
jgi:head-to-tail connecting protein